MADLLKAAKDPKFREDVIRGLGETFSRGVAGVLGAPVDLTTMAMRPFGYNVPAEQVVGGSEYIGRQMEEAGLISSARRPTAEFLANVLTPDPMDAAKLGAMVVPAVGRAMKAPRDEALKIAQANAAKPVSEGGLGLPPDNTAMDRARAMGYEPGLYHATGENFTEIDLSRAGKASGGNVKAFFTAKGTDLAEDYLPKEMVPKPEYARAYKNQERYQKALMSKYEDFSAQPDLFMKKPEASQPWQMEAALRSNPELSKSFESYIGNPEFIEGYSRNRKTVRNLIEDLEKETPRMHREQYATGANVMPLMVKKGNFIEFDAKGEAWSPDLDRKIQQSLREQGLEGAVDGVNIRNIYDGKAGRIADTQMIFNPEAVRSTSAAFDPAKRYESDLLGAADPRLLAGVAGATGAGLYGASRMQEGEERPQPRFGYRPDGTPKGDGWLGVLPMADGNVATEYSMQSQAVKVGDKMVDFPTLVPTLSSEEVNLMLSDIIPNRKPIPEPIVQKAIKHAKGRLDKGLSPFKELGE